jgi:hypothetical protein
MSNKGNSLQRQHCQQPSQASRGPPQIRTFISTVSAPPTPRSSAVTGSPARLLPMTMRPSRSRMSRRLVVTARIAMISAGAG